MPPGARTVAEILQAELLCAEDGLCSIGLKSICGNFRDVWGRLMRESCMSLKGE